MHSKVKANVPVGFGRNEQTLILPGFEEEQMMLRTMTRAFVCI